MGAPAAGLRPPRRSDSRVHSSIVHSNEKVDAAQVSISGQMDKRYVVCAYSGIVFSLKKARDSDTRYSGNEP